MHSCEAPEKITHHGQRNAYVVLPDRFFGMMTNTTFAPDKQHRHGNKACEDGGIVARAAGQCENFWLMLSDGPFKQT
jgi:hypothetical protein